MEAWRCLWDETRRRGTGKEAGLAALVLATSILPHLHDGAFGVLQHFIPRSLRRSSSPSPLWQDRPTWKGGPTDIDQELDLALLEEVHRHAGESPHTLLGKLLDGDPSITHVPGAATMDVLNKRRTLKRQGKKTIPLPDDETNADLGLSEPAPDITLTDLRRLVEAPVPLACSLLRNSVFGRHFAK